jgi:plastocyanin
MRRRIIAPIVLATVLVAAGCGDSSKPASSATTTPPSAASTMPAASTSAAPAPGSAAPAPSTLTVTIKDFKFGPAELTVPVGSEVSFMNADNQVHTVTAAGKFDTSGIQPGATAELTFDTAGTFTYMCALHPFMTGTITVA